MFITQFFRNLYRHIKYQRILNKVYDDDEIIAKMSTLIGTQFHRDWVGRLYAVVNPYIKDGKWDSQQAFEYTEDGIDTTEHAKQWILTRLGLMEHFIKAENLFDILTFSLRKLDDNGNYLFIVYPVTLPPVATAAKRAGWEILGLGAILTAYFTYFRNVI